MQLRRYSEMMSISMPLMDCCTARPVMACGKRSFLLPAGQVFSDHAACAPARVLRKNSAKQQKKNGERLERIQRRKAHGLQDRRLYDCTFANDNGKTPGLTAKVKRYVEHWEDAVRKNIGLLLFGDVGTGKSLSCRVHCKRAAGEGRAGSDDKFPDDFESYDGTVQL